MALYHLSVKVIARGGGKGRGAVASAAYRSASRLRRVVSAAAYRSASRLRDQEQEHAHDFTRKGHVLHAEVLLPEGAPERLSDREGLWNEVEAKEKRKDAQLAREVEIALPRELSDQANIALARDFAREHFVARGMVADVCVHRPEARDGLAQPHAHILLTMREVGPDGFGKKARAWNDRSLVGEWRGAWAERANAELERAGRDERVDHRSLAAQREEALERGQMDRAMALDREPESKIGAAALRMQNRELATDRVAEHERVREAAGSREEAPRLERGRGFMDAVRDFADRQWERIERVAERVAGWFRGDEGRQGQAWSSEVLRQSEEQSRALADRRAEAYRREVEVRDREAERALGKRDAKRELEAGRHAGMSEKVPEAVRSMAAERAAREALREQMMREAGWREGRDRGRDRGRDDGMERGM